MTATARANAACEPGVRSEQRAPLALDQVAQAGAVDGRGNGGHGVRAVRPSTVVSPCRAGRMPRRAPTVPERGDEMKIVVGYDGSDPSKRALERAVALADGGQITVVAAAEQRVGVGFAEGTHLDPSREEHARSALEEARSSLSERGIEADSRRGPRRRRRRHRRRGQGRRPRHRRHARPQPAAARAARLGQLEGRAPRRVRRPRGALGAAGRRATSSSCVRRCAGAGGQAPPAMAGRMTSVSDAPTGVSRPSSTRTSSSLR